MFPNTNMAEMEITKETYPSRTYNINMNSNRISGYTDGLDSVKQAIYLILSTERYKHPIYSWDYGVELLDLIGKPLPYVTAEIPRRITEALLTDNRIQRVMDFKFEKHGKVLKVNFTVVSNVGNIQTDMEVTI